jgi:cell division protease FtsH
VAVSVDEEVRAIIEQAHDEAYEALVLNRTVLDRLAAELLVKETLDHLQIAEIFVDVVKLPERSVWLSSGKRPVSDLPPIAVPESVRTDGALSDVAGEADAPAHADEADAPTHTGAAESSVVTDESVTPAHSDETEATPDPDAAAGEGPAKP